MNLLQSIRVLTISQSRKPNNMNNLRPITAAIITLVIATPVSALTIGVGGSASANVGGASSTLDVKANAAIQARITKAKDHADQEIARRVDALNELNTRVQ